MRSRSFLGRFSAMKSRMGNGNVSHPWWGPLNTDFRDCAAMVGRDEGSPPPSPAGWSSASDNSSTPRIPAARRSETITTTEPRMIDAPRIDPNPMGSSARAHPRKSAMTGFTYA